MRLDPVTIIEFIVQQILLYPVIFLVTEPIMKSYGSSLTNPHGLDGRSNIPDAVVCAIVSAALGFGLASFRKSLSRSGCWIWVLPTALFIEALLWKPSGGAGVLSNDPNPLFYATAANEGIVVMLLTLPMFSCIGYSLGMLISPWLFRHTR